MRYLGDTSCDERTRRLKNPQYSGSWGRLVAGSSNSIIGDGQMFSQRPPKTGKMFTAVTREEDDHTRPFRCCHGAIGQNHQTVTAQQLRV